MTMTTAQRPLTPAQQNFLNSLLEGREVPSGLREQIGQTHLLDSRTASRYIDALKALPLKARTSATDAFRAATEAINLSPLSFYAIPAEIVEANTSNIDLNGNDLLFIRTQKSGSRVFLKRAHGAPGGFYYSRFSAANQEALAKIVATDSLAYSKLFGEHYTVCGKCAAELTDQKSRELGYGPDCRKAWNL